MIASLRGILTQVSGTTVVVDVHGVGFELTTSAATVAHLPAEGEEVSLVVLTVVREDAITLYGFHTIAERDLFLALTGVSQIGPKMATGILGAATPDELYDAIALGDTKRLAMLPGVGKKTAARMALELKDKLPTVMDRPAAASLPTAAARTSARDDLEEALQGLGFRRNEIVSVIRTIKPAARDTLEDLLRRALAELTPKGH